MDGIIIYMGNETIPNTGSESTGNESNANNTSETTEVRKPLGTTPRTRQQIQKESQTTSEEETTGAESEKNASESTDENKGQESEKENDGSGEEPDYKTKFSESSKEALRLRDVLKAAGIDPDTGKPIATEDNAGERAQEETRSTRVEIDPQNSKPLTDEQLSATIPGFANLSESEKQVLRDTKTTAKKIAKMEALLTEFYDEREWGKQIGALTKDAKWSKIAEYSDEFKKFAYEEKNINTDLETLAASFLYQKSLGEKPAKKTKEEKPAGVEPGSNGRGTDPTKKTGDSYTQEEVAMIRKKDPKRYMQLARSGKLKIQ